MTGSGLVDAERAFARAARERRVAALLDRFRGKPRALAVHDERALSARPERGVREIPLHSITATVEPTRASLFDRAFRPAAAARTRWQRLWLAEHRGTVLPPISVVRVGDSYAVLDGHHRVSVAKARGACTIDATVAAG